MKLKPLLPHHQAWLDAHPHRTEDWLRRQLKDGFDVHHRDGDHDNNHPDNLFLVEHTDHFRLHGLFGLGRLKPKPKGPRGPRMTGMEREVALEMARRHRAEVKRRAKIAEYEADRIAAETARNSNL